MTLNLRPRAALLGGTSVLAVLIASPAAAATTTTSPGIYHWLSDEDVMDTLEITAAGEDGQFGVTATGAASAYAIVSSPSGGEIAQVGNAYGAGPDHGLLDLLMTNDGDAAVGAKASATNTTGSAIARAHTERGVTQSGTATTKASQQIANAGDLDVTADAHAAGTQALALATLSTGVLQNGAAPIVDISIANQGTLELAADAEAVATAGAATASAAVIGMFQHAFATTSALIALDNQGMLDIGADAHADGFVSAAANGFISNGIMQVASAYDSQAGLASAALVNGGTIAMHADAAASAELMASAAAHIGTGIFQLATGSAGGAHAEISNDGHISFSASADASAVRGNGKDEVAIANADVHGIVQNAFAKIHSQTSGTTGGGEIYFQLTDTPTGPVSVSLDNGGDISVGVAAQASADDFAFAQANANVLTQIAMGSSASAFINNDGSIAVDVAAKAIASASAGAFAYASGIHQNVTVHSTDLDFVSEPNGSFTFDLVSGGAGPAEVELDNSGSISFAVDAMASATASHAATSLSFEIGGASAIIPVGILQGAIGSEASVVLDNSGSIDLAVHAAANGVTMAYARANAKGVAQAAYASGFVGHAHFTSLGSGTFSSSLHGLGLALADFENAGSLDVRAQAEASADTVALANVHATGVMQFAHGASASALIDNGGEIAIEAIGSAQGGTYESAFVHAAGGRQVALATKTALAQFDNSGSIDVHAQAKGSAASGTASEVALANGFEQDALAGLSGSARFSNSGSLSVAAEADATGRDQAFAGAAATGLSHLPLFGALDVVLDNSGDFDLAASAQVHVDGTGDSLAAYGSARAFGYVADAANLALDITNSGDMSVTAKASASGGAIGSVHAFAGGLSMTAAFHGGSSAFGEISGTIANSGDITVRADVEAESGLTLGASASGIYFNSAANDAKVVNSGTLLVEAVTGHGGPATATGIRAVNLWAAPASGDHLLTIVNDGGTIIARQSTDGGGSWKRGMAIDLSAAPNASVVNLLGDGAIYGNVAIQSGDSINVENGTTYFDGIINPGSLPPGGVDALSRDAGLTGPGQLTIANGGTLVMADPRLSGDPAAYDGPSYAFVDTLAVAADGTLAFELAPATGGAQPAGSYAQLFADNAQLDGTLRALVATDNGLFDDSYSWQNVIDANSRSGEFTQCLLGGAYAGSLLLDFSCSYDGNGNVDLKLDRVAFTSVAGLDRNASGVAGAIERLYAPELTGDFADVVADLFLLTDDDKYRLALDELSGTVFADFLNGLPAQGLRGNDLVDAGMGGSAGAGSMVERRGDAKLRSWGVLDTEWRKTEGAGDAGAAPAAALTSAAAVAGAAAVPSLGAGTLRSRRLTALLGFDVALRADLLVGVDGGYVSGHQRSSQFGDTIDFDGFNAGVFAAYDPGAFFVKAMSGWTWLDGNSTRHVDFAPLGGSIGATPTGDPDANLWTLGIHAGARFALGRSTATPYVNLDRVQARLKSFVEDDGHGTQLSVTGGRSNKIFATGGLRWDLPLGRATLEADAGYRYRFGARRSTADAVLNGDPDGGFTITSGAQARGSFLAGLSVGGKVGPVDLSLGYQGEFNSDVTSHSGKFKISIPLGGK